MLAVRDVVTMFRASGGCGAVVVVTAGLQAIMLAALMRLRPGQRLVVFDFLLPRSLGVRRLARWALRRVDVWIVIRRGDAVTFARELGVGECHFVPFPAHPVPTVAVEEEPFVYAAGSAHRDWPTLVQAATRFDIPTVIATDDSVTVVRDGPVMVVPAKSPADGAEIMQRASVVCVPLHATELPAGPLIVLDALTLGKALVASDVNGTRDYVQSGSGLLVPPGDPDALGRALSSLMSDPDARRQLGERARVPVRAFEPAVVLAEICRLALA